MDKNNISIILPTLNEKKNLESLIPSIADMLKNNNLNFEYEILVVDDGSTDGTSDYVNSLIRKSNCISFIERTKKKSLPLSIYEGIENSRYNNVMWLDADGSMDIESILKIISQAHEDNLESIYVGSRFIKDGGYKGKDKSIDLSINKILSNLINSEESPLAIFLSLYFNKILSKILFKRSVVYRKFFSETQRLS